MSVPSSSSSDRLCKECLFRAATYLLVTFSVFLVKDSFVRPVGLLTSTIEGSHLSIHV